MQHLFDRQVYQKRREVLGKSVNGGIILIPGNGEAPMNYSGNPYRFRQDSNFLYYAGLQLPNLQLVINSETGDSILYGDDPTMEDIVWTGPQPTLAELAGQVGIEKVLPLDQLIGDIYHLEIHTLPPYRTEHFRLLQNITDHCDCSIVPSNSLIRAVIAQREIKDEHEIRQMEDALAITAQMHIRAMEAVAPGMAEHALAGIVHGIAAGANGSLAYGVIMSKNGHILHNHDHSNILAEGDLVLGDFGAENKMCYAGDITRTFPVSKRFEPAQRDIYEIVLDAQVKAINAMRPGTRFLDIHIIAARIIADGLTAHGIMKGNPEDAVAAGAHALFFPHGLGHMIGLDVHDMEGLGEDLVGYAGEVERSDQFGLGYLRMAKSLRPGHVITVEPGIYFIPALIDAWQADGRHKEFIDYDKLADYRSFGGVRIEDNVLVTKSGHEILGPPIPKSIDEVESLRK